jgi:hypothetical protein
LSQPWTSEHYSRPITFSEINALEQSTQRR